MITVDPNLPTATDLEAMAEMLERSGAYRVLRQLTPLAAREPPAGVRTRLGLFVDTETTGLDHARDEIIELAMVPFTYGVDGEIYAVSEPFQQLRQPSKPIPSEITAITGIDDAMVDGKSIDPDAVASFAAPAALVVAHNAAFDRKFLEHYSDVFNTKPWACSMSEVDWAREGFEGTKLAYLAAGARFFYERHRANHDCMAAIELLARGSPEERADGAGPAARAGADTLFAHLGGELAVRSEGHLEGAGISLERGGEHVAPGLVHRRRRGGVKPRRPSSRPKSTGARSIWWSGGSTLMTGFGTEFDS